MATSDRLRNVINSIPLEEIQYYHKISVDYGILDVIFHPYDYADTLIRLGYEPFPPVEESHLFVEPTLSLPGINSYVYYLYAVGGFSNCFRSVVPYVASALIHRHLTTYIINRSPLPFGRLQNEPRLCGEFTQRNVTHFIQTRAWKMMSNILVLPVSYPLHVIAVRTMARFVISNPTKEGQRPIIDDSWIQEMLKVKGVSELYAGFSARVFKELSFAVVSIGSFLAFMKFLQLIHADTSQADPIEKSIEYIGNSLGTMYSTPCGNASDIMIAQGADIPLGRPPFTENFTSCAECIFRLNTYRKWKSSGGGLFQGRPYTGAVSTINGKPFPIGELFGPFYLPWYARDHTETPPYLLLDYYNAWKSLGISPGAGLNTLEELFLEGRSSIGGGGGGRRSMSSEMLPSFITGRGFMTSAHIGSSNPFKL